MAILTGSDGCFCAGADLKALSEGDRRPVSDTGPGPMGPNRLRLSKPVIAAIEGPAVAGGLELAVWCDLRVVAADAVLGVYCRRFGVPLVDAGTVNLPRLIGHSPAIDLILTGRGVDGVEAERIGLANRVTEPTGVDRRRRARPRARRPAPALHAQRPPVGDRAVGSADHRGSRQRGPPGARDDRQRRDAGGRARFAGGAGRHGEIAGRPPH